MKSVVFLIIIVSLYTGVGGSQGSKYRGPNVPGIPRRTQKSLESFATVGLTNGKRRRLQKQCKKFKKKKCLKKCKLCSKIKYCEMCCSKWCKGTTLPSPRPSTRTSFSQTQPPSTSSTPPFCMCTTDTPASFSSMGSTAISSSSPSSCPTPSISIISSSDCSGADTTEVIQDNNKLHTPGFPEVNYEDNQEYCWRFRAKNPEDRISISFSSIETEYGYDVITIYEDGANEMKERVLLIASGNINPGYKISHTNQIRVVFKTDIDKNMKGFEASVSAVKKKDLPHISWEPFSDGKIAITFFKDSSNPIQENIDIKLAPHFKASCVFFGSTANTTFTVASPYSSSNCQSLAQHAHISMSSVYLSQTSDGFSKKATFAIKYGILEETTEEIFTDNVLLNLPTQRQELKWPTHIEIRINLAYDRSILEKFRKFNSGDSEIKLQLRQLFYFVKNHFIKQPGKTKIELLLKSQMMFINEVFKVNETKLAYLRKFQTDNTEPLIVICGDFDTENQEGVFIKGLSYRSGACRNNADRYGVALLAWHEDLAVAAEVMAHEIEHMFGMTHHGHTSHDIANWYSKQGNRCYTEACPKPPRRENGEWSCIENNKQCHLKCSAGFATASSIIHCENGHFSTNLPKAVCSPSVFLITGGGYIQHMEVYHSTEAITDANVTCSNLPLPLEYDWRGHGSLFFDGILLHCGGSRRAVCTSFNMESDEPKWLVHRIPLLQQIDIMISSNNLYIFDKIDTTLIFTTWPLQETPVFIRDYNFEYSAGYYCVVQIDDDNAAVLGGHNSSGTHGTVFKYNIKQQTRSNLSPMNEGRWDFACLRVKINGHTWLVVSGGWGHSGKSSSTERLNLDGNNTWETMNDMNVNRRRHQMIWTHKNVIIVLGDNTIELLDWGTKSWQLLNQSLAKVNNKFSVVELPAFMLGCQINKLKACPDLPMRDHGIWSCNSEKTKCILNCDIGFVSTLTHTTCFGGVWTKVDRIMCQPSVWFRFFDFSHAFYHPSVGHPICSKSIPDTLDRWNRHITFVYDNRLYNCAGSYTEKLCISLNLDDDEFEWKRHHIETLQGYQDHSSVILQNKFYISSYVQTEYTTLPLADKNAFTTDENITQDSIQCIAKFNEYSFVTIYKDGSVIMYNADNQTETQLANMSSRREHLSCIIVNVEKTPWLVVSGDRWSFRDQMTGRLDLSNNSATWEEMENLNSGRHGHSMINSPVGIVVIGGDMYRRNTVEVLNWTAKSWSYMDSLSIPSNKYDYSDDSKFVEVPASAFGCQLIPLDITECEGEYSYNQEYPGGDLKRVSDGETCHSVCEKEAGCKTWTWNAVGQECRLHQNMGTTRVKNGSLSGFETSCKPKCYLLLANQNASVSTQLCDNKLGTEENCLPLIQMAADEFEENNSIWICYTVEGNSLCEEIQYKKVELLCNAEPSIVTLSTFKRINKHRFTRHLSPHFKYYG